MISTASAQYFQQHIDYTISVTLDTRAHILRGHWEILYQNNSPDTLHQLVLHLYPNAYSTRNTAFARQQLRLGITDFHFADPADRGMIDSLDFFENDERIPWSLDKEHPDIAYLNLLQPLYPGRSVSLRSPIRVKIPKAFSRLGRIDDTYQLTQWYPKPAVYDQHGWHPIPYLNQGEFYGEFGSFDVEITLPEEYIVAASGVLQTSETIRLLDSLSAAKNAPLFNYPRLTGRSRTWHYLADNVHDFAWFADTRFAVRKETTRIGDRDVDCWAFFTTVEQELWERATTYIKDALHFYSNHIGPYPYPHMTGVQVPLGRDFGMEYPMITSINIAGDTKSLDDVLTHETGHNWFYGVLAFNERKHPWMDEGINTFYEYRYLREKYGSWSEHLLLHKPTNPDELSDEQRILQHMTRENKLVAPDSDPEFMTEMQNYLGSYVKPALAFHMLEEYMGEELFMRAMQEFYTKWKFKHPKPGHLQQILTSYCHCDLTWLFSGLLGSDQLIDYRIIEFGKDTVALENTGNIMAPVHLIAYKDARIVYESWQEGFTGRKTFGLNLPDADRLLIYKEIYTLDLTPADNVIFIKSDKTSKSKLKIRIPGGKRYPGQHYLNLFPIAGWNHTDKPMFGLAVSNTYWPPGNLQWGFMPLLSSATSTLVGMGEIQYRFFTPARKHQIELGLAVKSFHFEKDTHYNFFDRYIKIAPRFEVGFGDRKSPNAALHALQYRFIHVWQDYGRGIDFENFAWERLHRSYAVHELRYSRERQYGLSSNDLEAVVHAGKGFLRLFIDSRQQIIYDRNDNAVFFHAFGGVLPINDSPEANVNFNFNGIQSTGFFARDYLYDELLFSRNATNGLVSQLVFLKDAQLKTLYNGGISDRWMLGAGVSVDLPFPIPVQPYIDAAVYRGPFENAVEFSFSGGLALIIQRQVFEIFVPLIESKDIRNSLTYLDRDNIFKRISILVDLQALHPFRFQGY